MRNKRQGNEKGETLIGGDSGFGKIIGAIFCNSVHKEDDLSLSLSLCVYSSKNNRVEINQGTCAEPACHYVVYHHVVCNFVVEAKNPLSPPPQNFLIFPPTTQIRG